MRADEARRVLGLSAAATPADIKAAYRRLVKATHPDRHGVDEAGRERAEEALKRVIDAYRCLRYGETARRDASTASAQTVAPSGVGSRRDGPTRRTTRARRRKRRRALGWMATGVVAGAILASSVAWFLVRERTPVKGLEPELRHTYGLVRVEAAPVGDDWRLLNPTNEAWTQCRGWVGRKSVAIPELGPGRTLTILAAAFEPPLTALDLNASFELYCARTPPLNEPP